MNLPSIPVKAATKPETARQVKSSVERSRGFAAGGRTHGFGRGDHTATDGPDAAGPVVPAQGWPPEDVIEREFQHATHPDEPAPEKKTPPRRPEIDPE